jgi:thioester reductase-like protein
MAPSVGVKGYYSKKSIFITGATGFMGKVLVEKILRSCPDVHTLYLLMRPKKGKTLKQRLEAFLDAPVRSYPL